MVYLIVVIIFYFLRWFFHNDNDFTTDMYVGKKGCGKTLTIAKMAISFHKKGYKVYTNVDTINNAYIFNPKDLDSFKPSPNSVLLIDEVGLIWDARDFKNFRANEFFKYARQYKCKVIMFSQAFNSDLDLKIRNLVDNLYLMSRLGKIIIYRPVVKKLGIIQKPDGTGDLADTYAYGMPWSWRFTWAPRYYGLFSTYNPPKRITLHSVLSSCSYYYIQNVRNLDHIRYQFQMICDVFRRKVESSKKLSTLILPVKSFLLKMQQAVARTVSTYLSFKVSLSDFLLLGIWE